MLLNQCIVIPPKIIYSFKDEIISNILYNHHRNNNKTNNNYDGCFKKYIYIVNISILSSITLSNETHIFLKEAHVKEEIRDLNKNSSRGHDKMTTELRIQ